jgi:hypothetical protein
MTFNISQQLGPEYIISFSQGGDTFNINVGAGSAGSFTPSGTLDVSLVAAQDLNAWRAVGYDGLFTQPNRNSMELYAGVTRAAVLNGNPASVVRVGFLNEASWTWTPNSPVFSTTDGVLTQTVPTGILRRIGWAISPTQINLDPYPIIGV